MRNVMLNKVVVFTSSLAFMSLCWATPLSKSSFGGTGAPVPADAGGGGGLDPTQICQSCSLGPAYQTEFSMTNWDYLFLIPDRHFNRIQQSYDCINTTATHLHVYAWLCHDDELNVCDNQHLNWPPPQCPGSDCTLTAQSFPADPGQ